MCIRDRVDKRGKLYKAIKSKGRVVEFERQDERTLMRWILTVLKKEGRNITEDTMKAFLGRTGADMENISKELEKLICYTTVSYTHLSARITRLVLSTSNT